MSASNTREKLLAGLQKRDSTIVIDPSLNDKLGAAIRKSQSPVSKEKIYDIPVNEIENNPFQYRGEESLETTELESLAQSISTHGLRSPIQLRRREGKLILVAGWRRLTAIKRYVKSMTSIRATIDEDMDDASHRLLTIIENEQREDFTLFERAQAYRDLVTRDGYTQDQVAGLVGASKSRISRALKVLELPEDLVKSLAAANREGLSEGHIDELVSGFFKRQDREEAAAWLLDSLLRIKEEGLSIEDVRAANRDPSLARGTPKQPKKPLKKWVIEGEAWNRFEVSTRNKVTLEFKLPEHIQFNETTKVVKYIRNELLKGAVSVGKTSG